MLFVALFAHALAPYDPYVGDYGAQFERPSAEHWFGTDEFGRDVLSRIMYGARIALFVGFVASFAGCTLGALLGVVSAYCGGKVDLLLERVMDILLAFPLLILALAIASVLGPAVQNVVVAIAIPIIPRAARVVRATALSVKENQYVEAASSLGASWRRVILQHILPNVMAPYIIMLTAQLGSAILTEAALSLPGPRHGRADAVVGADALGLGALVRREGAVDRALPRHRDQPGRVRLQPLRGFPAGRARPQAPQQGVGARGDRRCPRPPAPPRHSSTTTVTGCVAPNVGTIAKCLPGPRRRPPPRCRSWRRA